MVEKKTCLKCFWCCVLCVDVGRMMTQKGVNPNGSINLPSSWRNGCSTHSHCCNTNLCQFRTRGSTVVHTLLAYLCFFVVSRIFIAEPFSHIIRLTSTCGSFTHSSNLGIIRRAIWKSIASKSHVCMSNEFTVEYTMGCTFIRQKPTIGVSSETCRCCRYSCITARNSTISPFSPPYDARSITLHSVFLMSEATSSSLCSSASASVFVLCSVCNIWVICHIVGSCSTLVSNIDRCG